MAYISLGFTLPDQVEDKLRGNDNMFGTNKFDDSEGEIYLACSDSTSYYSQITAIY